MRYDPRLASVPGYVGECLTSVPKHYGIAIDPLTGHVWVSGSDGYACELDPETGQVLEINGQPCCYDQGGGYPAQDIAIDGRGHVWIAQAHGTRVFHLAPDPTNPGRYYTVVDPLSGADCVDGFNRCTGVAVDRHGRIWVSEEKG
ncbi:MAG: hypothetical protein ACPMAQ_14190 [Phycisphaerae bacterium]